MDNTSNNNSSDSLEISTVIDIIWNALNKASKQGVYTIEESYTLKVLIDRLKHELNSKKNES
uniref:Uncharacterized protein n=1 Tax=Megaviridae environmental sample TaxID=1737588 RepID=A0A5J6VKC7_9VIRU|nr:MAG: hypothetical protein [Megaviridae environmental sample]